LKQPCISKAKSILVEQALDELNTKFSLDCEKTFFKKLLGKLELDVDRKKHQWR